MSSWKGGLADYDFDEGFVKNFDETVRQFFP